MVLPNLICPFNECLLKLDWLDERQYSADRVVRGDTVFEIDKLFKPVLLLNCKCLDFCGAISIGTADPCRDVEHLCRLLAEHLGKIELLAPVGDLQLQADDVHDQTGSNGSLLPDVVQESESLHLVLERLAARLGPEAVRRCVTQEDHRQEWMSHWQPAAQALPRKRMASSELPQPTWVRQEPLKLAVRNHGPVYQGELQLLAGPQCIEEGWWDRDEATGSSRHVVRDYWVAQSRHAGLLWIFRVRLDDGPAWFLHGSYG